MFVIRPGGLYASRKLIVRPSLPIDGPVRTFGSVQVVRGHLPDDKKALLQAALAREGITLGPLLEAFAEMFDTVATPELLNRARAIAAERSRRPR